jgi:hypothetical protein
MKWLYGQRLKRLLANRAKDDANELTHAALDAAVRSNLTTYMGPVGTILTKNAVEIYSRRAKYKDSAARGFESLLAALQNTDDLRVRVHSYMVDGSDYLVFTNPATTELHGVLIVDVRRQLHAGWFDNRGRWKKRPSIQGTPEFP